MNDLKIYIGRKGEVTATYALADLILALEDGRVLHTDLAWYKGLPDWRLVSEAIPAILPLVPGRPTPVAGTSVADVSHIVRDFPSLAI